MNKIKKILIFVTCFCFAFVFLFSINFTRPNTVKADYNLVNVADHDVIITNYVYKDINYGLVLLPNMEYKVSFDYNIISTDAVALEATIGYGELVLDYGIVNASAVYPNLTFGNITVTFITPATFEIPSPVLFVREVRSSLPYTSTVQISNIVVLFADENLGAIYDQAYNEGYYDGSKPPEVIWEPYPLTNDILSNTCYKDYESMGTEWEGKHCSSAVYNLPLGYYQVEQKCLPEYQSLNFPVLYPEQLITHFYSPIVYLDDKTYHIPIDIIGGLNYDRYIYFYVPYDNCPVRFQFASSNHGAWNTSYNSLNQIIALYFDIGFNNQYVEGYDKGYEAGKNFGYSEGKKDGKYIGHIEGYDDGYDAGFKEGDNAGYAEGYDYGYSAGASGSITTNWFTSFLSSTFDILNIEIFPNIKLVYLIFIPVGLGVLALILKMARG